MIGYDFSPDAERARLLDARMHQELGRSLRHIGEASRESVRFDEARLAALCSGLERAVRVSPGTFARYYEVVDALRADRLGEAEALFVQLLSAEAAPEGCQIVALGDAALGEETSRYTGLMRADDAGVSLQPPDSATAAAFRERLQGGLDLLDRTIPELAGEIRGIVRQIVICGSDRANTTQIDGGSHYQLWGALFLNAHYHADSIAVAEVLAHESAHSLLFGFCVDEPLVENAPDELFASPLRADPRPMDGIYHATFVSARMHWVMSRLGSHPALSAEQQRRARDAAQADRRNFVAGDETIRAHGRLSAMGHALLTEARKHMSTSV
jgi:hypothetical protein